MNINLIFSLAFTLCISTALSLSAQDEVQLETNLILSGTITVSQDDTKMPVRGMIRFDTLTNTFEGFDGAVWINLGASGADVNNRTDTLEIGDSFGGGIVFHTVGVHGLIVTEFDIVDPNFLLDEFIKWGGPGLTEATSDTDGTANTQAIIAFLEDWTDDMGASYAAKICDELALGVYTDWYLPSREEFRLINEHVGTEATGPNANVANITSGFYWTSTDASAADAYAYRTSGSGASSRFQTLPKSSDFSVRAIRSY